VRPGCSIASVVRRVPATNILGYELHRARIYELAGTGLGRGPDGRRSGQGTPAGTLPAVQLIARVGIPTRAMTAPKVQTRAQPGPAVTSNVLLLREVPRLDLADEPRPLPSRERAACAAPLAHRGLPEWTNLRASRAATSASCPGRGLTIAQRACGALPRPARHLDGFSRQHAAQQPRTWRDAPLLLGESRRGGGGPSGNGVATGGNRRGRWCRPQ
jgi:hypothetical protein